MTAILAMLISLISRLGLDNYQVSWHLQELNSAICQAFAEEGI